MFSKSMTFTAAVVAIGIALPATALASPAGAGAPASANSSSGASDQQAQDQASATNAPHGAIYTAQAQERTPEGSLLPFSDAVVSADVTGALASRTPTELAQQSPVAPTASVAASDSGFDWGDAGIGALASLVLAGIAAGGYMQLRRGRQRPALHPSGT
jgi:hypothetical protein